MTSPSKEVSDIRSIRLSLRIAFADLSRRTGIEKKTLSRYERGLESPTSPEFEALARELAVSPDDLQRAHKAFSFAATPGEGYTTVRPTDETVHERSEYPTSPIRGVLDIFCGAGGLSYGFEQSGLFTTTCGIDLLPDRVDTFRTNHRFAAAIAGDLRKFPISKLGELALAPHTIVGGPPCQGFSSIRPFRTLTEGDPRNSLVEQYVLVVKQLRPNWFVFENVVGILAHESGRQLQGALRSFSELGYRIDWRVLNASHYGVPQNRERVVIVGNRLGVPFLWPQPTHHASHRSMAGKWKEAERGLPPLSKPLPDAVTVIQAISDLPPVAAGEEATAYETAPLNAYQRSMRTESGTLTLHRATAHSEKMMEIIRHSGANISALPEGMVSSGFSSCYSRLDGDRPSTTITVNFVHPASNRCIHPTQNRALTPREGARLQSFPDTYRFLGTWAQIVKQIGNAVPPLLGRHLAEAIVASETAAGIRSLEEAGEPCERAAFG
jgi:DNA (cytosine-5)-methyltransferase 1